MTATQRAVVDDLGNINVHGRSALQVVWKVKDAEGAFLNISASDLFIEIAGSIRVALTAGEDNYSRKLSLTRAQIAALPLNQPLSYALHDETPSSAATIWSGKITAYGFRAAPPGADAVEPGTASWTGATVTVMQGESVPTVVVTYMGATGYGVPTGGTVGQYIRKASATNFDTAWDTITADDVSGLSASLSTLTSADVSLTSRVSTEEAGRGSADTSLTSRLSTEETARGSADTSLATAAAATYLPLAGGVMSGVLASLAGTAALPGLAVAGDLNTGIYAPAADTLGLSVGGVEALRVASGLVTVPTKLAVSNSALGGNALDAFTASAGNLAVFQHNAVANGGNILAITMGNALTGSAYGINLNGSSTGGLFHYVQQNGTGNAGFYALVTGAGDAVFRAEVNGVTSWTFGLDNSDSDAFVVSQDSALGSNNRLRIATDGVATLYNNLLTGADNTYDVGAAGANRVRSGYFGTNVVIGNASTSTAQLHVGAGAIMTVANGGGLNISSQVINSQTSGTAVIGVGVNDGTNNRRAGLFVNQTDGLWGLASNVTSGAIPFILFNNGSEHLRIATDGVATLYNNLLTGADNTYDVGAAGANRVRSGYFGTNVVIGNASTSTAQLHVGAGAIMTVANGGGLNISSQVINSQTSGTAVIGVGVNDGTNNRRAGLFVNQTDGLWGLASNVTTGAIPFILFNNGSEHLRVTTSGQLGIGENNPSYLLDAKATSSGATVAGIRLNNDGAGANTRVSLAFQAAGTLYQSIVGGYGAASPEMQFNQLGVSPGFWTWNSSGTEVMRLSGTGVATLYNNLLFGTDNTYDIGASGSSRPRIAYIGTRIVAPTVTTTATTVAGLPAAATAGAGGRAFVTDATATTYLSIVAGGGANAVPVVSNGTNWLIG
jgi:hypothetical protein